jgi:membrane protein implicated in regulation of membrane protease activity
VPHRDRKLARPPLWAIWLIGIPLAVAATLLAVFFFTLFLVVFVLAATIVALRLWWLRRQLRNARSEEVIEGEYTVVRKSERLTEDDRGK